MSSNCKSQRRIVFSGKLPLRGVQAAERDTMRLPFVVNHGHHRAPACVSLTTDPSRDGLAVARTSALQHVLAAAVSVAVLSTPVSPAVAVTDGAAIGKCLLANCQIPLAKCITNPTCLTNLLCIQTCTNRPPACRPPLPAALPSRRGVLSRTALGLCCSARVSAAAVLPPLALAPAPASDPRPRPQPRPELTQA